MTTAPERPPDAEGAGGVTRLEALRGLRLSTWEAVWATVWLLLTSGPFQTGFALQLGATPLMLGLIAGLPAAVGLLQLPASLYRGPRKRLVAFCALAGRLCWLPILALPFVLPPAARLPAFLLLLTLASALLTVTVPAWTSWMSDLVPPDSRGRYFARRNMLAGIVTMIVPLPAGWFLDLAVKQHRFDPPLGFGVLFALASLAAAASFSLILRQPEPPVSPGPPAESPLRSLAAPLADANFRRFLAYAASVVVGQTLAGQFFVAWQVGPDGLQLPYLTIQLLGGVTSASGLAATPAWGYLADKFGARPVLMLSLWGTLAAPLLWIFTSPGAFWTNLILMLTMNLIAGSCWAGVGLTQFNLLIHLTPASGRATYVAVYSAATGIVGGIAPIVGGALMALLASTKIPLGPLVLNNYKQLFLLTVLIRIGCLLFLKAVKDPESRPTRFVLEQIASATPRSLLQIRRLSAPAEAAERRQAVEELGGLRAPLAVEELAAALEDVAPDVRASAARALGEIGDIRAIPALAAKLLDPAAGIGERAAEALGAIGDRRATMALMAAARGPDAAVRIASLKALGKIADPDAAPVLLWALDPTHPTRCESACAALTAIGKRLAPEDAAPAPPRLLSLLSQEGEEGTRVAAARALAALAEPLAGRTEAYGALVQRADEENDPSVLAAEAAALTALGREAPDIFARLLAVLDRLDGRGLAYKQALSSLADTALPEGTLYPYLGLSEMARDEAASRLLSEAGRKLHAPGKAAAALEAFTRGDYAGCLESLAALSESPPLAALAERARRRDDATPEEALLGMLLATTRDAGL